MTRNSDNSKGELVTGIKHFTAVGTSWMKYYGEIVYKVHYMQYISIFHLQLMGEAIVMERECIYVHVHR